MAAIVLEGVGKAYRQYPTRWARLVEWTLPFAGQRAQLHWVLRDIDLQVGRGEAVGIVGINGAGKSTLLKIITGTTHPTTGTVRLEGQVAALLELGMGFHPDFTGRQNVYMAGQLLGMDQAEVSARMAQIEGFAEVGDYIDQPVRVYSSGMQMRLAFSVAVARRPDVLIVDEALSVGDAYFQHKSFERIREFRREGTTLLLVSHDTQAIQSICDRAILLNRGLIEKEGPPEMVMDYYNAMLAERQGQKIEQRATEDGRVSTISGTGEASVADMSMLDEAGNRIDTVEVGESVVLSVVVEAHKDIPRLVFGFMIKDRLGQIVYGTNTHLKDRIERDIRAGERLEFRFAFRMILGPGSYSVATAIVSSDTHLVNNYEWRDLALLFTVTNSAREFFAGGVWLDPVVEIRRP